MNKFLQILFIALTFPLTIKAGTDDRQSETRENPDIENSQSIERTENKYPEYINTDANIINLNGDNWSNLAKLFEAADSCPVTITHIGDSHLQADMATAVIRNRLATQFGQLRGRGLIIPFKIAGTNEPSDYILTSESDFIKSKLLKMPWPTEMGFTGIGISPINLNFDLSLKTRSPYSKLSIFYTGDSIALDSVLSKGCRIDFISELTPEYLHVELMDTCSELTLNLYGSQGCAIHGISTELNSSGLAYHVIGNNGATYSSYNLISTMGADISMLLPDLVIVSLGTNEAFGRIVESEIRIQIDALIREIRQTNPFAKILLTTPAECQRKIRRRRRARYVINQKVKQVRDIILAYAAENAIPVYDWYEVAGGDGTSKKWLSDRTLNSDRIHLTRGGYQLQGDLFADALIDVLKKSSESIVQNDSISQ